MLLLEDVLLCKAETRATKRVSASCRGAVARATALAAAQIPGRLVAQLGLIEAHTVRAGALQETGDATGALDAYAGALAQAEAARREWPDDPQPRSFAGEAHASIGDIRSERGEWGRALDAYRAAVALWEPTAAGGNHQAGAQLVDLYSRIGSIHARRRAWADARDSYRRSLDLLERSPGHFGDEEAAEREKARRGLAESEAALASVSPSKS